MTQDPYDNDPPHESFDDDEYAIEGDAAQPPTTPPAMPAERVVYCTSCGVELRGLSIGQPCTNCGVPVGSAGVGGKTSGMAITSMILGICSIPVCMCYGIFSIIIGIVGLVLASLAKKEIASGGYNDSSKGMATAGKICSWIGIALGVSYILIFVAAIIISNTTR